LTPLSPFSSLHSTQSYFRSWNFISQSFYGNHEFIVVFAWSGAGPRCAPGETKPQTIPFFLKIQLNIILIIIIIIIIIICTRKGN
jgi:hypothetical protein